jgi:hypothetical protein
MRQQRHVVPRAGEIVIAAAACGRLLSPRAGPLRAARRGLPSRPVARRRAPDDEGTRAEEAPRPGRCSDALRRGCLSASERLPIEASVVNGVSRDLSCRPGQEATRLGGRADPASEMPVSRPRSCRHAPSTPVVQRCASAQEQFLNLLAQLPVRQTCSILSLTQRPRSGRRRLLEVASFRAAGAFCGQMAFAQGLCQTHSMGEINEHRRCTGHGH